MFEYMKKQEIKKCGQNSFWNQYLINYETEKLHFNNIYSDNCQVRVNFTLLSKICKIDCKSVKYRVSSTEYRKLSMHPKIQVSIVRGYNIEHIFQPKLTIVNMFSNFGGLVSMYFGLSIMHLVKYINNISSKNFIGKNIKLIILGFNNLFKLYIYIIVFYQIKKILDSYLEYNTIIKIHFSNELKLTKMAVMTEPYLDADKLEKYFPQFKPYYDSLPYDSKYDLIHIYLYDILIFNLTLFIELTRLSYIRFDCEIELDNNTLCELW